MKTIVFLTFDTNGTWTIQASYLKTRANQVIETCLLIFTKVYHWGKPMTKLKQILYIGALPNGRGIQIHEYQKQNVYMLSKNHKCIFHKSKIMFFKINKILPLFVFDA